jgi:hypothetical protein
VRPLSDSAHNLVENLKNPDVRPKLVVPHADKEGENNINDLMQKHVLLGAICQKWR